MVRLGPSYQNIVKEVKRYLGKAPSWTNIGFNCLILLLCIWLFQQDHPVSNRYEPMRWVISIVLTFEIILGLCLKFTGRSS